MKIILFLALFSPCKQAVLLVNRDCFRYMDFKKLKIMPMAIHILDIDCLESRIKEGRTIDFLYLNSGPYNLH